jgi:hypothetical protein
MRLRHALWGLMGIALILFIGTLKTTHHHALPEKACTGCHGPGILRDDIMRVAGNAFTGPDACEPCHSTLYHLWTRSEHCRSMMNPGKTTVFSNFSPDTVKYSYRGFATKMISGKHGYSMVVPGPDGKERPYKIDLIVGIKDQQAFLTKFPDGRYQILPSSYDMLHQTWFDATEGIVPSDHVLKPNEDYFWTNMRRNWNRECFNCHLSGMEKNYDPFTNTYDTKWRDLGIDCEACHGPGHTHTSAHHSRQTWSAERRHVAGVVAGSLTTQAG